MKHKRTLTMLVCGAVVTGVLFAAPASVANAFTCLGSPSGDNTGNSDPRSGEYDDSDCPYSESYLEEQWRNEHSGLDSDSSDVTPVDTPDYSITPYSESSASVPPIGDNAALNPLDAAASYLNSALFSSAMSPDASAITKATADYAASAVAGGIKLDWDHLSISEAASRVADEIYSGVPAYPFPQNSMGSTADEEGRRSDKSGVDKKAIPKGLKVITNKNVGKDLGAGNDRFMFSWKLGNGVDMTRGIKGMEGLKEVAEVTPVMSTIISDLVVAYSVRFYPGIDMDLPYHDDAQLARAVFATTNNNVTDCIGKAGQFVCNLDKGYSISSNAGKLGVNTDSDRTVPICSGGIVDAGPGLTSSLSLDQAGCESSPEKKPVRLVVDYTYADASLGIPLLSSDGAKIEYAATAAASGQFVSSRVWAVSADGTYSFPFNVIFRVRNSPAAVGSPSISVLRGMESVVPTDSWFSDVDRDKFQAQSGDYVTPQIVSNGSKGTAWFQGSELHYVPAGLIKGEFDDQITVKAVDRFGLSSGEVTIPIHVSDVIPTCMTGGSTTDASTPVRINPTCFLSAPAGWQQLPDESVTYSIVKGPQFGTISGFDPSSGTALFTPDRAHPGADSITVEATYNSHVRDTVYALNVLSAP